jgi:GDP-L-fucose synthase
MVGSAIARELILKGYNNLVFRTHDELDLTNQEAVKCFFEQEKPDYVYLAAARVGGIHANNTYPAEFIFENLMVQNNVIHQAFLSGVKKLLFLGSSCIYPKFAEQPIAEDSLLTGKLEPTNEPYAIAKIAGIKMCESYNRQYGNSHGIDYRSVMPTNLYGPGDNYHPENSHVIPALIRRLHEAKLGNQSEVMIWGTGKQRREFLYVEDMAKACIFVMEMPIAQYKEVTTPFQSHINVGYGEDVSIAELAFEVAKIINYEGMMRFDTSKSDGPPQKLISSRRLNQLGWCPQYDLKDGLSKTYMDFRNRQDLKSACWG